MPGVNQSNTENSAVAEETKVIVGQRLEVLLSEGKSVQATSADIDITKRPDYFDADRFERAQKTCLKYYTNLSLASSTGLILLLQIESVVIPLLKTGRSRTVVDLYDRYVATSRYIRNCYESKFYEQDSVGWRNIVLVRSFHTRVHELMKKDEKYEMEGSGVWVNQYDMSMTQFAFIGLLFNSPTKCGAYHITIEELMDVAYFWRLLSYYFGIEDRFNLFVYHDAPTLQIEYMKLLLSHTNNILASSRMPVGTRMAEGFMLAFEDFTTESTFNILDHWWSPDVSLSGLTELKPYSISERWKLIFFQLYFKILFRSDFFMGIINRLYKWKFDKFEAAAEVIKPKLAEKYSHLVYDLPC